MDKNTLYYSDTLYYSVHSQKRNVVITKLKINDGVDNF